MLWSWRKLLFFLLITVLWFSTDAKRCYFAPYYDNNFFCSALRCSRSLIYENDVTPIEDDASVPVYVCVQIHSSTSPVCLLCAFTCQRSVLAHSSLFLPNIDNANLSFSSLIFSRPPLCARSAVAVKSTHWLFVRRTQRSICSC